MKKIISICLIFFYTIFLPLSTFGFSSYTWSTLDLDIETSNNLNQKNLDDSNNSLNLNCESCILIEQHTGKILYSYNSHAKLKPASITKLMSIYLIMEAISNGKIDYNTNIPCSENAESMGGSQIWLNTTENLTVDEMLKAICVVSANDCVTAMAEYLGGTEENFVDMMNEKAKELNLKNTQFKNCHGIDEDEHFMSAYDIAMLSRELLNNYPEITKYTTIYMDSLRDGKSGLVNTNKLVRNYSGCTGLKTGSTSLALYNLSASATRNNMSLIAVVMKAPSSQIRFKNATALLDYGFANFEYKNLINKNEPVKTVSIKKGIQPSVQAISDSDCGTVLAKGQDINIEQKVSILDNLSAPIAKGQIIGSVSYILNEEIVSSCNLISDSYIEKNNFFSLNKLILDKWFFLLKK